MNKPINKIYAHKLRALRIKNDIKQHVLAQELNLKSQQQYSKLELGQKPFSKEIIRCICDFFHLKEAEFISEINETVNSNENAKEKAVNKELETVKTVLALKSQINDFQVIINLVYSKLLIEKEIELINVKIQNYTKQKNVYWDGDGKFILLDFLKL